MSMKWYAVQAFSGFEKSVQKGLEERVVRSGLQDQFGQILVPIEEVIDPHVGRHVQRADDRTLLSQRAHSCWQSRVAGESQRRIRLLQSRQTEIQKLDSGLRQHDVAGFEIPVRHARPVRFVKSVQDLRCIIQPDRNQ